MSEENRFTNKKVLALSISLVVMIVLAGVFGVSFVIVNDKYNNLSGDYGDYNELYADYLELLNDFNILETQYSILTGEHIELENDFNALKLDLDAMTAERDVLEIERDELLQDIIDLEAIITGLEADVAERDAAITDLNSQITNLENVIINLNSQIVTLGNTIIGLEADIVILENTIVGLQTTIADLNSQIVALNAQIDTLLIEIANLEGENQDLIDYYEDIIAGLNYQIGNLTIERDNLIIDLADMTTQRDNLQNALDAMTIERNNLQSELDAMTTERDNLVIELANMTLERDNLVIALSDMTTQRDGLIIDLADMTTQRDAIQNELDILTVDYNTLLGDYQILSDANDALQIQFNALTMAYEYVTDTIRQSILPVQYSIFAEAVRRYYMDTYLDISPLLPPKIYWLGFAEYCRDVILHDSWQENSFIDVSDAFSDALIFESDTMRLAWVIMEDVFYNWLPNWGGYGLTGNKLTDIDTIVDWCIDEIDYEYDSNIDDLQEYFEWDYIKFPVETAFRTMGDCEDQAILTSTYLESCGFETTIIINHDPNHPTYGEFYHGTLWVHIEDPTAFWSLYPTTSLWTIDGGINLWYWADTTWDVPFGSTPAWLQDYIDYNIPLSWDIATFAICDIGGQLGTNVGENLGLTCVMPT